MRLPKRRRRDAGRQVRRAGREDVAAVKGAAHGLAEVFVVFDKPDLVLLAKVDHGEHAVIRRDEVLAGGFHQDRAAGGAHARVDHHDVHGLVGKGAIRLRDQVGTLGDGEGCHLVADIDDSRARADAQDHAFHGGNVMIGQAEIGGQGKDGHVG